MVGTIIAIVIALLIGLFAGGLLTSNGGTYKDENISLVIKNNWLECEIKTQQQEIDIQTINAKTYLQKCEQLRERLQISPYGDDKIDELEQTLEFVKFENQQLRGDVAKITEYMSTKINKTEFVGKISVDTAIKHIEAQRQEILRLEKKLEMAIEYIEQYGIIARRAGDDSPKSQILIKLKAGADKC
jgi:predicted RNA-binding protein Jag